MNVLLRQQHTLQANILLVETAGAFRDWGLDTPALQVGAHPSTDPLHLAGPERAKTLRTLLCEENHDLPPGIELCYPPIDPFSFALQYGQGCQTGPLLFWLPPLWSLSIGKSWGLPVDQTPWVAPDLSLRPPGAPNSRRKPDRTARYLPWDNLYQKNPELALVHLYGILLARLHAQAFDAKCQLALLMGSHPRLGGASPLRDLDENVLRSLVLIALASDHDDPPTHGTVGNDGWFPPTVDRHWTLQGQVSRDVTLSPSWRLKSPRLLQALPGRAAALWSRALDFTTHELWIFFLMGQHYYKFPLRTPNHRRPKAALPPRSPPLSFCEIPGELRVHALRQLSHALHLPALDREPCVNAPHVLRERSVTALTVLILNLTCCPTSTISDLWLQIWPFPASAPEQRSSPPFSSRKITDFADSPPWTCARILETIEALLGPRSRLDGVVLLRRGGRRGRPRSCLGWVEEVDGRRSTIWRRSRLDAWVLETLTQYFTPGFIRDLFPGLQPLLDTPSSGGRPHSLAARMGALRPDAGEHVSATRMLVAWMYSTTTHSTLVIPQTALSRMRRGHTREQSRELEWGLRTLWQTAQGLISDWRRTIWAIGMHRTLALMMGSHHRVGRASPLQALDDCILACLAQDAFVFDSGGLEGGHKRQGLQFSLRLPLDPSIHKVIGQVDDTIGAVITRLAPRLGEEADLLITMNDSNLLWSDWVHDSIVSGALVTVSLNIRANATPCGPTSTRQTKLTGPLVEVVYSSSVGSYGKPQIVSISSSATPRDVALSVSLCDPYGSPAVYLTLNGRVLSTSSLNLPLSTTPCGFFRLQLLGRLRGGMPHGNTSGPPDPSQHGSSDATMHLDPFDGPGASGAQPNPQVIEWLQEMKIFADTLGFSGEQIADELDAGLDRFVSPADRKAILCGGEEEASLQRPLVERVQMIRNSFNGPWDGFFSATLTSDTLAPQCTLASSFIEGPLMVALQSPSLYINRRTRVTSTGSGDPLTTAAPGDRETIRFITGFKDQNSLSAYLLDLGFEPPLSASRHKKSFIFDMFSPHSGSSEESTASGQAILAVRRTPEALKLLVDIMDGKRLFAPQIEPQKSGLVYVHRNVVYRTSAPKHTGAAGGAALDRRNLLAAPTMILDPVDEHEALKYELAVRLLTTLGLSSDGFCTLMVLALRRSGTPHLGAAEICPAHHRSIANVFTRVGGGRGHLRVNYSPFKQPEGIKTIITFDLSSSISHCCAFENKYAGSETILPELLRNLVFTLTLQKQVDFTDRERESTASTVIRLHLVDPKAFFVEHHNLRCDTGAQDILISDSPSRDAIEDWLRKHVISFLQRLLPAAASHIVNDDTVDVELTTGRQNQIGVGSQMLIHFRVPTRERTPLTPQVAATLALQLGALVACRAPETKSFLGLQWCPLMSLLPGYPHLGDLQAQRCDLIRVSWRTAELTTGSGLNSQTPRIMYKLPDRKQGTFTPYEASKSRFLIQLARLFTKDPCRLSPACVVSLAACQGYRNSRARETMEDKLMAEDIDALRPKNTELRPVLMTPAVLSFAQSARVRTITCFISPSGLEAVIGTHAGGPGTERRVAFGVELLKTVHSKGFSPIDWVLTPPTLYFEDGHLRKMCPDLESLLQPDLKLISRSATLQVPFCLQCRRCFEVGVYDPHHLISHCLGCVPFLMGFAATDRHIQNVLSLHRLVTTESPDDQSGTAPGRSGPPTLTPAGSRQCDEILNLLPHPLPHLLASSMQTRQSDPASRTRESLEQHVREFLFRAATLHASLNSANHPWRTEAAIRQWGLESALRSDVGKLMNLLVQFSSEATGLSQANTLHGNPLPDHFGSDSPMTEGPACGDRPGKAGTGRRNHPSDGVDLLLTNPDSRRGVRDPRPDERLPFSGPAHNPPPGSEQLPQHQARPPGTLCSPSTPLVPTALS